WGVTGHIERFVRWAAIFRIITHHEVNEEPGGCLVLASAVMPSMAGKMMPGPGAASLATCRAQPSSSLSRRSEYEVNPTGASSCPVAPTASLTSSVDDKRITSLAYRSAMY